MQDEINALRRVFSKGAMVFSDETITVSYPEQYGVFQNCDDTTAIASLIENCRVFRLVFGLETGIRLVFEFPEAFRGTMYYPPLEYAETPEEMFARTRSLPVKIGNTVEFAEFFEGVDMNDDFAIKESLMAFLNSLMKAEKPAVFDLGKMRVWKNMLEANKRIGGVPVADVDISPPDDEGFGYIEYSFSVDKKCAVKFTGAKKSEFAELFRLSPNAALEIESSDDYSELTFTFFNMK